METHAQNNMSRKKARLLAISLYNELTGPVGARSIVVSQKLREAGFVGRKGPLTPGGAWQLAFSGKKSGTGGATGRRRRRSVTLPSAPKAEKTESGLIPLVRSIANNKAMSSNDRLALIQLVVERG